MNKIIERHCILIILVIIILPYVRGYKNQHDYYALLQITRYASRSDVKSAFKRLSLLIHLDKNKCDPHSTEKFILLKEAFDTLYDDNRRYVYNRNNPDAGFQETKYDWNIPDCDQLTTTHAFLDFISWLELASCSFSSNLMLISNKFGINHDTVLIGILIIIISGDVLHKYAVARFCVICLIVLKIYHCFIVLFCSYLISQFKLISVCNRFLYLSFIWTLYIMLLIEDHHNVLGASYPVFMDILSFLTSVLVTYWICLHNISFGFKVFRVIMYVAGLLTIVLSGKLKVVGCIVALTSFILYSVTPWFLTILIIFLFRVVFALYRTMNFLIQRLFLTSFLSSFLAKVKNLFGNAFAILVICVILKFIKHLL